MAGLVFLDAFVLPMRRQEPALAVAAQSDFRLVKIDSVPELARHLFVHLVQCFAVVRVSAAAHISPASKPHF